MKSDMINMLGRDEIITRQYQENDDEEIVALLRAVFPTWEKIQNPVEYWRWKYLRSPLETHIAVTTVGGKIAGLGHCFMMHVKLGDKVLVSYYDDDYATSAEYRDKGIYKITTNYIDEFKKEGHADFCYWITTNPIVLTKANIHEQISFPTPFSDLVRIRDIDRFIEKFQIEKAAQLKDSFKSQQLTTYSPQRYIVNDGLDLLDVDSFDERFEKFWDEVAEEYNYFLLRDRDFMNWRFTQNPIEKYQIKVASSGGEIIGYAVLEIEDFGGYTVGSIYDLLPARGHNEAVFPIFSEVVKYFDSLNIDCISLTTMQGHPLQKIAASLGFVNAPYASEAYVRFWGYNDYFYDKMRDLKAEKIYFSYSDYDWEP